MQVHGSFDPRAPESVTDRAGRTPATGGREALDAVQPWLEQHSGWATPTVPTLAEWLADGACQAPDGCWTGPAGPCPHGLPSWWAVLLAQRVAAGDAWDPARLVPRPDRLDLTSPGALAAIEAHESAVEAGEAGYPDPRSGLFVMSAPALWARGACCTRGCRHCPY